MARPCFQIGVVLLIQVLAIVASPIDSLRPYKYAVKDRHLAPVGWSVITLAPQDHLLHISIGLKQDRFHELEKILYQGNESCQRAYYPLTLRSV